MTLRPTDTYDIGDPDAFLFRPMDDEIAENSEDMTMTLCLTATFMASVRDILRADRKFHQLYVLLQLE